ncbi:MAG TPA: CheR family methyltransferase [Stellaceae bacterium]|nr:CheR family methyltransferase [Stellaceae bacterium]
MPADRFPVVGIGASAGGVEALQAFFEAIPADPGMAFIVVTHVAAGQESALAEILARWTALPIEPIRNGAAIEPNHAYVLASDAVVTLSRGRLRLVQQPAGEREHNRIDIFFASLAEDRGEDAVAVILSGVGHDGTLGAKAIKESGGFTVAQIGDHPAPRYPQMPAHAIASGAIDLRLPVEDMAGKLIEYARGLGRLDPDRQQRGRGTRLGDGRLAICKILHEQTGHDFSGYKERTFLRRIERRMQVLDIDDLDAYAERLRTDRQEVISLFQDLLIGVTAFFRDRESFEALAKTIIPGLFKGRGPEDTVRVWVPGCATGEEAYSIAMLLLEHMETLTAGPKAVVFATDIDEPAISIARLAQYPAAMLQDVSPQRIDRYFTGDGISYTVAKQVRDLCIFSSHSVIRDPPFSRIDLISCRNLLIYLDKDLQNQLVPVFHYALRPGGFLFLGSSEALTTHGELFTPTDKKNRIFRRRDLPGIHPKLPLATRRLALVEHKTALPSHTGLPLRHIVESRVVEQFAPAHVVVTRDGEIVHFSTRTGRYLENAPGAPTRNIVAMARRGLRVDLRTALTEAIEMRRRIVRHGLHVEIEDRVQFLDLTIEPLADNDTEPLFLVVFADIGGPIAPERRLPTVIDEQAAAKENLERELREARDRLQSLVEEYETALEELKSANEELISINEELQSTNEELETSREEAQSIAEELQTVNNELERKVEELDQANDNLRNLFDVTEIAIVTLDRDLLVRSFTPAIKRIFNLMDIDRGRPLTDIVSGIVDLDLRQEIEPVLAAGASRERRVTTRDGKAHYLMRVVPYRTAQRPIDGVLVTFADITRIAEGEAYQEELRQRIDAMLRTVLDVARRSVENESGSAPLHDRLRALSNAYGLVSGADLGVVPLAELATRELADFGIGREGRVAVDGPPVLLRAHAAISLAMALHELAARATAEGALSVPQGRVHLDWAIEPAEGADRRLVIRWRESGSPAAETPDGAHYGRALIETGLREQIGTVGSVTFGGEGMRAEIALPLASGQVILPADMRRE